MERSNGGTGRKEVKLNKLQNLYLFSRSPSSSQVARLRRQNEDLLRSHHHGRRGRRSNSMGAMGPRNFYVGHSRTNIGRPSEELRAQRQPVHLDDGRREERGEGEAHG